MTQSSFSRRRLLKGAAATAALIGSPAILRAQAGPVRIGIAVPTSGPMSFIGNYFLTGIKLATDYYNRGGGLLGRQIELVVRDDKFSGAGAIAAAREFAGMGVNLQMGGSLTSSTLAVLPILDELNAAYVAIASFTTSITHENFNRRAFRPAPNNYFSGRGLARSAMDRYKDVARWQVVAGDNAFGRDAANVFMAEVKAYAASKGIKTEVQDVMLVGPTQTDFKTQINQLASSGVDGVYSVIPGAAGVAFNRQAVQVGYDKACKVIVDINGAAIAKELGSEIPANLWGNHYWPRETEPMKSNKQSQELFDDYVKTHNGDKSPSSNSMVGARSASVLFEGIKKAKSIEVEPVIAAIEGIKFEFLGDPMTIRKEDHQGLGVCYYGRIAAAKNEEGWSFEDAVKILDETLVEPPSPGKELKL